MKRFQIREAAIAAIFASCAFGVASAATADDHTAPPPDVEMKDGVEAIGTDDGTPPPGTLNAEGVVPMNVSGDGAPRVPGQGPIEPIGHVPGPDEGVYGDPPNTGGTVNPETRGWAYDPGYFFAMTKGLATDTDLSPTGIRWVRPWTLTFDVVTLPTAALAGLSGRAPKQDPPNTDVQTTTGGAIQPGTDAPTGTVDDAPPGTGATEENAPDGA